MLNIRHLLKNRKRNATRATPRQRARNRRTNRTDAARKRGNRHQQQHHTKNTTNNVVHGNTSNGAVCRYAQMVCVPAAVAKPSRPAGITQRRSMSRLCVVWGRTKTVMGSPHACNGTQQQVRSQRAPVPSQPTQPTNQPRRTNRR